MSDQPRSSRALPAQPSLRYLKIEAKGRLADGEFPSLHEAQLAIAREHGMKSWAALKAAIEAAADELSPALGQVRWVAARFRDADNPAWTAPGEAELREHFDDHYLTLVPAGTLIGALRPVAAQLGEDLLVTQAAPRGVRAQIAGLRIEAATEPDPPHRLTRLRMYPLGERVADSRVVAPATRTAGDPPSGVLQVAEESFAELGLAGLVVAGATKDGDQARPAPWALALGWADLDSPANAYLSTLRLSDDSVTVRALLTHAGGVASPDEMFADRIPDGRLPLPGTTVTGNQQPGAFAPSNGGYAVLGQLIADVTGSPYPDAIAELVLRPLGMDESWFPARWPDTGAVTGYQLTEDGSFDQAPRQVCTLPAAGGLWTTATDLVRFGLGWSSLLPEQLHADAVRPQAAQDVPGADIGLGWLVSTSKGIYGHPGAGPGAATSLMIRPGTGTVTVVFTNRRVSVEPVNARLIRPIT